jgi:hypothetical protein
MRGDFSQIRFDRSKNYTAVLKQQGRVDLDADANEQCLIYAYESGTELTDVVGDYGGPIDDCGFAITVSGNDIQIGAGRYYVEGLLCENTLTNLTYETQPYLITAAGSTAGALLSQLQSGNAALRLELSLQVWQRLQTALDDPSLLEPAIGTADTTARLQTVWRVIAQLVDPSRPIPEIFRFRIPGSMTASVGSSGTDCGCGPVAAAGYQGIENQLYRVEIHTAGDLTDATFKWSRENGSVVAAVIAINGSTIAVNSLGPDANLGFQVGQWVELTDDTYEFGPTPNSPGTLYQIQNIQSAESVTLNVPQGQQITVDPTRNARMRRWDQSGTSATANGIALSEQPIQLENGIQVQFGGNIFNSGDYWTIPARTATGNIEWPQGESLPATSIQVYNAPLATVFVPQGQPAGSTSVQWTDTRQRFSPLTALNPPATPPAIHVNQISWVNDEVMTLDQLVANGITVTLDQTPTSPITPANFAVTVETATPNVIGDNNPPVGQTAPTTVLRSPTIVDQPITASGNALTMTLPFPPYFRSIEGRGLFLFDSLQRDTVLALNTLLNQGAPAQRYALVRVRLLGEQIYCAANGGKLMYLDGRALGQAGTRPDNTARIDLVLPSGSGTVASNFEGWFFLAPTLQVTSVTFDPSSNLTVQVGAFGQVTGVEVTGSTTTVNPTAVVNLNYPAIAAATISLALTGTGAGTVASIQATAPVAVGDASVSVPINILQNPGVTGTTPNTPSFTVIATLTSGVGSSSASANFTVTGVQPPPPILHIGPILPVEPTGT